MAESINLELTQTNPWWIRPELINNDPKLQEFTQQTYQYLPEFISQYPANKDAIFILRGPRQVGKTTLMKLVIQKLLLEHQTNPQTVFYYPLDRIADYNQLFDLIKQYLDYARPRTQQRLHLFLDEITFVNKWVRAIKDLSDRGLLKHTTLTITGSNILDLTASGERLPGRRGQLYHPDITIHPLHFGQFLNLINPKLVALSPLEIWQLHAPQLQKHFHDYLITGGFLYAINLYSKKKFLPAYAYELIADWVTGDMLKLDRSENFTLQLIERITKHLTSQVSLTRLARESGMTSAATSAEYIELLNKMQVLLSLPYWSLDQRRTDNKKNQKIYFHDPLILISMLAKARGTLDQAYTLSKNYFSSAQMPTMAELLTSALLHRKYPHHLYYGMSKKQEIDFVTRKGDKYQYYEVKYQDHFDLKKIAIPPAIKPSQLKLITKNSLNLETHPHQIPLPLFLAFPDKFVK